ncbi:hypothetical protein GCM10010168_20620 [Actinoplanes ianthinogenes]|nr:hypothetical protein GCM10010168_20620 [Actinoplanes ianthinogenes]
MIRAVGSWCLRVLWVLAAVLALAFVLIAYHLFRIAGPDTFERAIAEALIEIAFVVLFGAALTHLLQRAARVRADEEAARREQLDFLRRLAAVHSQVAYAQRLMDVHRSGKTYAEEHRRLMRVVPLLEEIDMDLKAAEGLFGANQSEIEESVEQIAAYLAKGGAEYGRCHASVDAASHADSARTISDMSDAACDLSWTLDFLSSGKEFVAGYRIPLTAAKAAMRKHAYRPRVR